MGLTRVFLAISHNSALASSPASRESSPVIFCSRADSACPSMSSNAGVAGPSQSSCSGLMCESLLHTASIHCLTTLYFPLSFQLWIWCLLWKCMPFFPAAYDLPFYHPPFQRTFFVSETTFTCCFPGPQEVTCLVG